MNNKKIDELIIKFAASPSIKLGDVAQLSVNDNKPYVIKSDGTCPIGIVIGKTRIRNKKTGVITGYYAKVAYPRSCIFTKNYDKNQKYPINASLYINSLGEFTTYKYFINNPCIGMVLDSPTTNEDTLHLIWF